METLDYRSPHENQRAERPYVPISRFQLNVACALVASVLSAAAFLVVLRGAHDEPYMAYHRSDAGVQVGVGTALIVLWCSCAVAVAALVATRKLPLPWLALLPWAVVCVFYLSYSPSGYLSDLENHILPASGSR